MWSSDRRMRGAHAFGTVRAISPKAESEVGGGRHYAPAFTEGGYRRQIMTIERAISGTVYTQLVATTSILAKLAVCAILLASMASAHAASGEGVDENGVSRRSGVHAAQKVAGAKPRPIRKTAH